jgi:hypothetical protein
MPPPWPPVSAFNEQTSLTSPTTNGSAPSRAAKHSAVLAWLVAVVVVLVAALAGVVGWRLRRRFLLAAYRGLGQRPLSRLSLDADLGLNSDFADAATMMLYVGSRSLDPSLQWQQPPKGPTLFGRQLLRPAYTATYSLAEPAIPAGVTWTPRIKASGRWWRRGGDATDAIIREAGSGSLARYPWERVLTAALGLHAAGRIEWTRVAGSQASAPITDYRSTGIVALDAPDRWTRYLADSYGLPPEAHLPIRIRHVIGRVVITSAGPRIEGARQGTLGLDYLTRSRPSLAILQAEPMEAPFDEFRSGSLADDLPEKLQLATDLIAAGIPAVLILPVLPEVALRPMADLIRAHAEAPPDEDPRLLRRLFRGILKDMVPLDILDDLILFLNPVRQ